VFIDETLWPQGQNFGLHLDLATGLMFWPPHRLVNNRHIYRVGQKVDLFIVVQTNKVVLKILQGSAVTTQTVLGELTVYFDRVCDPQADGACLKPINPDPKAKLFP